jgi:hypothetical protein
LSQGLLLFGWLEGGKASKILQSGQMQQDVTLKVFGHSLPCLKPILNQGAIFNWDLLHQARSERIRRSHHQHEIPMPLSFLQAPLLLASIHGLVLINFSFPE